MTPDRNITTLKILILDLFPSSSHYQWSKAVLGQILRRKAIYSRSLLSLWVSSTPNKWRNELPGQLSSNLTLIGKIVILDRQKHPEGHFSDQVL